MRDATFGGTPMHPRPARILHRFPAMSQPLPHDVERRREAEVKERPVGFREASLDFRQVIDVRERHRNDDRRAERGNAPRRCNGEPPPRRHVLEIGRTRANESLQRFTPTGSGS